MSRGPNILGWSLLVALIMSSINVFQSFAQPETGRNQIYFNCDLIEGEKTHCYPSPTPVTAHEAEGISKKITEISTDTATYEQGKYQKALKFPGYLGEYVTMKGAANFTFKKFSISFWIKREPSSTSYAPIISYVNAESNAGWLFDLQKNGSAVRFGIADTKGDVVSPNYIPIEGNKFVNIVGTFDGSSVKVYRDGNLYSSVNFTGAYNPDPRIYLRLGLDSFDNENSWIGSIDDLRIYDGSIDEQKIKNIYNNSIASSENLVGYWPFDGTLKDLSGNNHDAILRVQTVGMTFSPDGRLFFTVRRTGEVRIMLNDRVFPEPFIKISNLYLGDHEGLLGITLDPNFMKNHFVYVYSTYNDNRTDTPFNRVLRYTDSNNKGTNMTVIIDRIPADKGGYYAGGALTFGPDEKLYVTVGIGSWIQDAQNISSVLGKVLRINRDGTIPTDNPFPNSPVYTLGHKNVYGIAFDKKGGSGLITDNGYTNFDEVNLIKKGGNYGFPNLQYPSISDITSSSKFIPPIRAYNRVIAPAQAIFYVGFRFPQLSNSFVIVSYDDGNLHALSINRNASEQGVHELVIQFPQDVPDNIVALAQSPTGDLYYGGYDIYKVKSFNPGSYLSMFPVQLNVSSGVGIENMSITSTEDIIGININLGDSSKTGIDHVLTIKGPKNLEEKNLLSVDGCKDSPRIQNIESNLLIHCSLDTERYSHEKLTSINLVYG